MGTISDHLTRAVATPRPRCCIDRPRPRRHLPPGVEEMAAETANLWTPGTTLRIAFHLGTRDLRACVMAAAGEWMRYANIKFVEVDQDGDDAEVRCEFDPDLGSWSYVGRDILHIPKGQPTMNIGWGPDLGTCLHELGHTLGLIHEHESPAAGIPWNKPAVYAFYGAPPNQWSPAEVDQQVFERYAQSQITNTAWDKNSIMEYPIPAELVTDPSYAVGWNQQLSPTDIAFIAQLYPRT